MSEVDTTIYWTGNRLFSYDPDIYWFLIAIGSRGRGKTTTGWRWVLKRFLYHGEKFIWWRLTETPIRKAARAGGSTLVPPVLLEKLGIERVFMRGTVIFVKKKGGLVAEEAGVMDAISTYHQSKGLNMDGYTNIVFDEINRETNERNTFDVVRAFLNQIESAARMRKIRVLMLGNTIHDTSDILDLFRFQPKKFGIYKLKRRHAVLEYMDDSEEFKRARKNSLAGVLLKGNEQVGGSFFNKVDVDDTNIIKFNNKFKGMFIYYVGKGLSVEIYNMKEGGKIYIGKVRNLELPRYKISPFLTMKGIYDGEIYRMLYENIGSNNICYEDLHERSKFINAMKNNRNVII